MSETTTDTPETQPSAPSDPWAIARLLRAQGMQWSAISSRTGLTPDSLRCKASRQGWAATASALRHDTTRVTHSAARQAAWSVVDETKAIVAKVVSGATTELLTEVEEYRSTILGVLRRGIDHLHRLSDDDLDLGSVESLARALKLLDDVGRRTHGLDQDTGRVQIGLRQTITIIQPTASPDASAPIEV